MSGDTVPEIRLKHRAGKRTAIQHFGSCLSALAAALERATAADPSGRFESASAFANALAGTRATARMWAVLASLTLAIAAILSAMFFWRGHGSATAGVAALRQFEPANVSVCCGGPSPDGKWYAYTDTGDLIVRQIHGTDVRRLTENRNWEQASGEARTVVFSPDSMHVAYTWDRFDENASELRIVPIEGGAYRTMARVPRGGLRIHAWSPDKRWIAASEDRATGGVLGLIDASSGERRLFRNVGRFFPHMMSFSPDGRLLAYDLQAGADQPRDIYLHDLERGTDSGLIEHSSGDAYPVFTADGRAVVFWSDRTGRISVWRVRVMDARPIGDPELVFNDVSRGRLIGTTRSGDQYYSRFGGSVDVHVAELTADLSRYVRPPEPVNPRALGQNIAPDWSRDGTTGQRRTAPWSICRTGERFDTRHLFRR